MNKGFAPILVILIVVGVSALVFTGAKKFKLDLPKLTSPPSPGSLETPSLTPSPTNTSSLRPTTKPTSVPIKTSAPTPPPNIISAVPGAGYSSGTIQTEKGAFSASILSIDLSSTRVITDTANDSDCGNGCATLSLSDYVARNGGFAGVNGTYFCPASYSECAGKTDTYDFPVYNTRLGHWINPGNLFWNGRAIFYVDGSGAHYLQNANSFGGGLTAGIVNYPGLVSGGNVQIDDNQSGLSDKQKAAGTKVGIGVINSNKIIVVVAKSVNMQQFAYVFKALGATGALNLDTGGSAALYHNGYKYGPGRNLPNAIIFTGK